MTLNTTRPRPELNEIPIPSTLFGAGEITHTADPGQWNGWLQVAYDRGDLILDVEQYEGHPIKALKAYRKNT